MTSFRQELTRKILITFLIILIPVGILVFLGSDISRRAESAMIGRQQLANKSEGLALFASLQNQSKEADAYITILQNVLPSRDQLFDFQREMERLAVQDGVGLGFSFQNETPATASEVGRAGFNLVVEGSLYKVLSFIKLVEEGRFLVNFKSFDFSGAAVNISGEVLFY
jgi:Tfp pilus assembly protein PilO